MLYPPTKSPTPGEYRVILFLLSAGAILFGGYCLYRGFIGKIADPDDTRAVLRLGFMMIAAGTLGPMVGNLIARRFFD